MLLAERRLTTFDGTERPVEDLDSQAWDNLRPSGSEFGLGVFDDNELHEPAEAGATGTTDPHRIYIREIQQRELLTAHKEIALAKTLESGLAADGQLQEIGASLSQEEREELIRLRDLGEDARRKLIESNLRLVVSIANRYANRGMALQDLIQEGNLGLYRAVEKYEWRKGFRFSTYAYWWIRQAISRAIADQSRTIRLPVHINERLSVIGRGRQELNCQLGHEPEAGELADYLGMSEELILQAKNYARVTTSLNAHVGEDDGDVELGDIIAAEGLDIVEEVIKRTDRRSIDLVLDTFLTGREAAILRFRFGIDDGIERSLSEIGAVFGVSRERIRQIEGQALRKLRNPSVKQQIREMFR